jgi:hypothetical protein
VISVVRGLEAGKYTAPIRTRIPHEGEPIRVIPGSIVGSPRNIRKRLEAEDIQAR